MSKENIDELFLIIMPLGILAQVPHKGEGGGPAGEPPLPLLSFLATFFLIHPICRSK